MAEKTPDVSGIMDRFLSLSRWKADGLEEERKNLLAQIETKKQTVVTVQADIAKIELKIAGLATREGAARKLAQTLKATGLDDSAVIVALQSHFGTKTFRPSDTPVKPRTAVDEGLCDAIKAQLALGTKLKKDDLVRITLNGQDPIAHARAVGHALQSLRASKVVKTEGQARGMFYAMA